MSRKTAAPEQPGAGGSYVRQEDGSLKRMEFTAEASPSNEDGAAPADQKTADPKTGD